MNVHYIPFQGDDPNVDVNGRDDQWDNLLTAVPCSI